MAREISPTPPGIARQVDSPPGLFLQPQSPSQLPPLYSTDSQQPSRIKQAIHTLRFGIPQFAFLSGDVAMPMAQKVASHFGQTVPKNPPPFANNELRVKVDLTHVAKKDIYLLQTTNRHPDECISQLELLMVGAKGAGANRDTGIILHMPYMRQDNKRHEPGEPEAARQKEQNLFRAGSHNPDKKFWQHKTKLKAKANLLFVDVHSIDPLKEITHNSGYQWANLDPAYVLMPAVRELIQEKNLDVAIVFPDHTAEERYSPYAEVFGGGIKNAAIIDKERILEENNIVKISQQQKPLKPFVDGKDVIIIDDIADTMRTVLQTAKRARDEGARSVWVVATHGIFSVDKEKGIDAYANVNDPAIDGIIVTNTIKQKNHPKITVVDIDPLIREAIRRIENRQPLGELAKNQSKGFDKSYRRLRANGKRRKAARQEWYRKTVQEIWDTKRLRRMTN